MPSTGYATVSNILKAAADIGNATFCGVVTENRALYRNKLSKRQLHVAGSGGISTIR
jgi:hypothetical protein